MSNVETVRGMFDAFHRRDAAAARAPLHPDIVWDATRVPTPDLEGVYHGVEGVADFWRRWLAAWEAIDFGQREPEFLEHGDKVLVWVEGQVNRGRASGVEVEMPPFGFLWTFQDGRAVRMEFHRDRSEALAAAGIA